MKRKTTPKKPKKLPTMRELEAMCAKGVPRMAKKRTCSECGESLEKRRPQVLTCSGQCRTARQRRLAK